MAAIDVQGPTATAGDSQSAQEEPGNGDKMEESTRAESLPGYLPWENDLEMVSKYLDRKEALEESHHHYLKNNPEMKSILADFLQALLIQKPDDVYEFAREFFTPFDPKAPHAPSYPSYKPPPNES